MAEATLTAWRRQIAKHLAANIDEVKDGYASPISGFNPPCVMVYPGGHDDYVTDPDTTFGARKVSMSLQFLFKSDDEERSLASFETIEETIEDLLGGVPWAPAPSDAEVRRVLEPRYVKFPNGTRYFAGQIDIYLHRTDPNC